VAKLLASRRVRAISTRKAFVVLTGRYRSGQTGQTVNLLALRLRWFESSPAQTFLRMLMRRSRLAPRHHEASFAGPTKAAGSRVRIPSSPFAGHLRGGRRRILHRRSRVRRRHRVVAVPAAEPHSLSTPGLQRFGH
jgi:hypothetical protein